MCGISRKINSWKKRSGSARTASGGSRGWKPWGTLAGGIAHDFNNILLTIMLNTEMALMDMEKTSPAQNSLPLVLQAANRGRELVEQIITFSRQQERERKPLSVSPVLKETLKFLRSFLPKNIEIRENIRAKTDVVLGDPSQIHQILMNLCSNAAHAMQEKGGVLEVKLEAVDVDSTMAAGLPELKPGPHLHLTVSDTGHGMAPEVMERIFDPFFTTKGPGKGSGMGLAVVHGILKRCGGAITVSSEPDKGSTFNVFIPRIETVPSQRSVSSRTLAGGKERILIVEDEDVQLQSMVRMLEWLGYRVTAKTDGREALAEFQKNPHGFDLVITDQAMPVMTGAQLTEALLKILPEIPIILCTGFSEAVSEEQAKAIGVREFIHKPFSIVEMSEKIRRVLSEPTGPHREQ